MPLEHLPKKPNIVLIITDQEREVMHWPEGWAEENLQARNRLMAHGLTFRNAHCVTATCSPSRASLMTSLYPAQHGVKGLIFCDDPNAKWQRSRAQLSPDIPNIATVMADAGYHVVLKGKFHLSRPVRYDGEAQRHYWSDADIPFMAERYGFHEWNPPDMSDPMDLSDFGGGNTNNDGRFVDGTGTAAGKHVPKEKQFRQSAVHFLNSYDGDKPFCLIVSLVNPHDVAAYPGRGSRAISARKPIYEQAGYKLEDFENLPIDLPPTVDEDLSTKPSVHSTFRRTMTIGAGHVRSRTRQRNYARFYAYLCREVDQQIGKVLDALDANGLTENTLIIRTSDHGELGMAHGKMREKFYNAYRESLSVPLIFSNPKLFPEPQTTNSFASLIDILPTLTTIADVPDPERFQFRGKDLTPIFANPESEVQDYIHFTYEDDQFPVQGAANCIRAIVEKEWKYAVYYDPFRGAPIEYELYDLKNDPYETTNLAHPEHYLPAYAAIPAKKVAEERRRLHNRLLEVMQTHGTAPPEVLFPSTEAFEQAYEAPQDVYHDPIHSGIKRRQRIYGVIAALTSLAALYQLVFQGALLLPTVAVFVAGVLLGVFVFSRINKLSWDNEQGQIVAGMDIASILILLVYVGFIIFADTPLLRRIIEGGTADAASFSLIAGIMFGEIRGLRAKIRDILGPGESSQRAYSTQIDIDAPAEQVWSVVTDFESYHTWNPLLTDVQGKLVVGDDLRVRAAFAPMAVRATVTVVDKPNRFEWEDHVPLNLLTPVFSVRLLPLPENRTRVVIAETFTGPLLPVMGRRLDSQMPPLYEAMGEALAVQVKQRASATSAQGINTFGLENPDSTENNSYPKRRNNMRAIILLLALVGVLIAGGLFVAGISPVFVVTFVVAYAVLFYLALPRLLNVLGLHPHYKGREFNLPGKRALLIGTNHDTLGETGKKTGVALSELSVPYYQFLDAGMQVDLASVKGGNIPIDPQTTRWPIPTPADRRFLKDETAMNKLKNSLNIDDLDFKDYDIVFMAGGWGASYDLGYSEVLGEKTTEAYLNGAVLGSVCHGVLGFLNVRDENGEPLLQGRNATGVTDKQVRELGINITPMHPETELRKAGARFNSNTAFNDFFADITVVDGRLVTGQNQNAGAETAQKMMMLVEKIAEGQAV